VNDLSVLKSRTMAVSRAKRGCIGLIPIGSVPAIACKAIVSHIRKVCRLDGVIFPALPEPAYAHDPVRNQYDAAVIIDCLERMEGYGCVKLIGLMNLDLFIPIFTHVFGEARDGGRCAVVSMFRLGHESQGIRPDQDLILERTVKVAVHELGHLFRVPHCADPACLMRFSMDLMELDAMPIRFCRYCNAFF
jgi:archaemetzincin